jgi:hypothetical protein
MVIRKWLDDRVMLGGEALRFGELSVGAVGRDGIVFADIGEAVTYCPDCAEREFGKDAPRSDGGG